MENSVILPDIRKIIYALQLKFIHTPAEFIEDAVIDSITIYYLKAPENVKESVKKSEQWIRKVAFRRVLFYDKKYKKALHLSNEHWIVLPEISKAVDHIENVQTVEVLLNNLSPLLRTTVKTHHLEGHSLEETARLLETNIETVKKRLHRAFNRMSQNL